MNGPNIFQCCAMVKLSHKNNAVLSSTVLDPNGECIINSAYLANHSVIHLCLLLQRDENQQMVERIDSLSAECQKHETNWTAVDESLSTVEKHSSSLSEACKEAVQKVRQCVTDSIAVDAKTKVYKLQNIGAWLLKADFLSTVRAHSALICYKEKTKNMNIFTDQCYGSALYDVFVCLSVCHALVLCQNG